MNFVQSCLQNYYSIVYNVIEAIAQLLGPSIFDIPLKLLKHQFVRVLLFAFSVLALRERFKFDYIVRVVLKILYFDLRKLKFFVEPLISTFVNIDEPSGRT